MAYSPLGAVEESLDTVVNRSGVLGLRLAISRKGFIEHRDGNNPMVRYTAGVVQGAMDSDLVLEFSKGISEGVSAATFRRCTRCSLIEWFPEGWH